MATRSVRFEFQCLKETMKFTHNIPSKLVSADAQASQQDPAYIQAFVSAISPIMKEHERECRAASDPQCQGCGAPSQTVLQTPMSWLHIVADPFVSVWVNPVCGKQVCEMKTRQQIQDMMALMGTSDAGQQPGEGRPSPDSKEILPCKICGKTGETLRCGRCKLVAYCGKDHQKQDWKVHKHICAIIAK
ncbi:hypothetical protein PVAG01_08363 [Phlyctema vagabunda]|uniref:MYND-type domain-containing protein n=1 Tax=Phlyctema vagabunda TaxID=108571 RepID=A0ABR4P9A3_9HELO